MKPNPTNNISYFSYLKINKQYDLTGFSNDASQKKG
tara:strand:- start:387 stop:494 length:108 start_codon:yes stop_codon:yes gene_type:complete